MRAHDPLPDWITHIALLTPEGALRTGPREELISHITPPPTTAQHHPNIQTKTDKHVEHPVGSSKPPLVSLTNLTLHPPSSPRPLLSSLTWDIHPGSRWHLTGANGSGKSTLLALLTGHHPLSYTFPVSALSLFGRERAEWRGGQLGRMVGWVGAEVGGVWRARRAGRARAEEVVRDGFGGGLSGGGWGEDESQEERKLRRERTKEIVRALGPLAWRAAAAELETGDAETAWAYFRESSANAEDESGLSEEEATFLSTPFSALSPGAQSLVLMMRALVSRPPLLLLDEPWAGMSAPMLHAARRYLTTRRSEEGGAGLHDEQAVVLVTHWEDEVPWQREEGRRFRLEDGIGWAE